MPSLLLMFFYFWSDNDSLQSSSLTSLYIAYQVTVFPLEDKTTFSLFYRVKFYFIKTFPRAIGLNKLFNQTHQKNKKTPTKIMQMK